MNCQYCDSHCIKYGKQKDGTQKYRCKSCGKSQQGDYSYNGCSNENKRIIATLVEGKQDIREISRKLHGSPSTVIKINKSQAVLEKSILNLPEVPENFRILDLAVKPNLSLEELKSNTVATAL